MKFSKRILIVLSGAGLLLLGACSSGQQTASPGSSPAASPSGSMSKMEQPNQGGQSLKPVSQTGEAQMTLSSTANPLPQGKNTLMLTVMDAQGQSIAAKDVQVAISMSAKEMDAMGMKGMGEGSAKTTMKPAAAPGQFEVATSLPFGGNWELKAEVKDAKSPASAVFKLAVK